MPPSSTFLNESVPPRSQDSNNNGIPDECETRFRRGDANASGLADLSDALFILGALFLSFSSKSQ